MPSVYLTNVTGDGVTMETAWRADIPDGTPYAVLMTDQAKGKSVIVSTVDDLAGTGIVNLITGTTWADLRNKAKTTNPTGQRRTTINTWLTNNDYETLPAGTNWYQTILFVARQVNPVADLDTTKVGP